MTRTKVMITAGLLTLSTQVFADTSGNYNPKPGQWSTVVEIFDNSKNHYLLKTSVNDDLEACSDRLKRFSTHIHQANGMVWTNRDKSAVTFEQTAQTGDRVKVLEVRCVLEPFQPELVKKF